MNYLLVGYGNIGAKRRRILGDRCVATVDPVNPEADFKTPDACPPDRYDAVLLATPNSVKLDLLERFLRLRKHVLVEKPLLFPDEDAARRMEAVARENRVVWYTAYNHRFEPAIAEMQKRIGELGAIYSARLFYGNGTVRHVAGSWRDGGLGVFEDLGCHLLDLAGWMLGARGSKVRVHELRTIESKGVDRFLMSTEDQRIVMEGSFVSWKNTFTIDVTGEKGSMHVNGLCKWGPSELVVRQRVLPSGVPKEERRVFEGPDVTWERDLAHFEKLPFEPENDRWISTVIGVPRRADATPAAFVGMSHLGIVSGIGWASLGRPVVAFDPDAALIARLEKGQLPIHEPGLAEALARSRVRFTADPEAIASCPLVVVARDVPTDDDNVSSLKPIEEMFDRILPHVGKGATLVHMSQVPPGFTRRLRDRVRASRPDVEVIYQVETLIFGNALERAVKPERFMIGCADPSAPLPSVLETGLRVYGCPILKMRYESAELCKTAINLYLCGGVTYANTLSWLCEEIGADWSEIVPALRLDRRIGPAAYIQPSLGIAGGNLERDLVTVRDLCRAKGVDARFLEAMIDFNERRHRWAVEAARKHIQGPRIAVWGLAYKRDTASTKNSRSLRVIGELRDRSVVAYDPVVGDVGIDRASLSETLRGADGLMIMTDWPEFGKVDPGVFRAMKSPVVIDCVGVLRGRDLPGVKYHCPGRCPTKPIPEGGEVGRG